MENIYTYNILLKIFYENNTVDDSLGNVVEIESNKESESNINGCDKNIGSVVDYGVGIDKREEERKAVEYNSDNNSGVLTNSYKNGINNHSNSKGKF